MRYERRASCGGSVTREIDVPPATHPALVPVLLLQPLVENAVKHGFAGCGGGVIRVAARRLGERLTVSDDGRGASPAAGSAAEGVGLSNTRARLEHLYPGKNAVRISSPPTGGFVVVLTLPWQVTPAVIDPQALDIPIPA
jgi:two-component system, LytTR family, sensor kinase